MTETRVVTREAYALRYRVGRPLILLGVLCGVAAAVLYEAVALNAFGDGLAFSESTVLTAAGVLALVTAPVVLFGLAWQVRFFRASATFAMIGVLLCMVGVTVFALTYPLNFNVWGTGQSDYTVLFVNLYGLGLLCLIMGLIVGHSLRTKHLGRLASAILAPPERGPGGPSPRRSSAPRPAIPRIPRPPGPHAQAATPMTMGRPGFSGEVHYASEIPGIDEDYARQLRSIGVTNTAQLLARSADGIADQTGISENLVRSWRGTADLLRLPRMKPADAAMLYRAGFLDVGVLASASPALVQTRTRSLTTNGQKVNHRIAAMWIKEAKAIRSPRPARRARPTRSRRTRRRRSPTRSRSHVVRR